VEHAGAGAMCLKRNGVSLRRSMELEGYEGSRVNDMAQPAIPESSQYVIRADGREWIIRWRTPVSQTL